MPALRMTAANSSTAAMYDSAQVGVVHSKIVQMAKPWYTVSSLAPARHSRATCCRECGGRLSPVDVAAATMEGRHIDCA